MVGCSLWQANILFLSKFLLGLQTDENRVEHHSSTVQYRLDAAELTCFSAWVDLVCVQNRTACTYVDLQQPVYFKRRQSQQSDM